MEQTVRQVRTALLRWGWLVVVMGVAAGGVAYVVTREIVQLDYTAHLTMMVGGPTSLPTDVDEARLNALLAATYAGLADASTVLDEVAKTVPSTTDELRDDVRATSETDEAFVEISVTRGEEDEAISIANEVGEQLIALAIVDEATADASTQELGVLEAKIADGEADVERFSSLYSLGATRDPAFVQADESRALLTRIDLLQKNISIWRDQMADISRVQASPVLTVIDPAHTLDSQQAASPLRNSLLGAVAGVIVAIFFILVAVWGTESEPERPPSMAAGPARQRG